MIILCKFIILGFKSRIKFNKKKKKKFIYISKFCNKNCSDLFYDITLHLSTLIFAHLKYQTIIK